MNRILLRGLISLVLCFGAAASTIIAQSTSVVKTAPIKWEDCMNQKPEWYSSDEAVRIADNVLLYQRDIDGWFKNIDMAAVLTENEKAEIIKQKGNEDSTIDNGATYTQVAYLAKVYTARKLERHRDAFFKGVDYLLKAQYENGGWPQYYPKLKGYYKHITFNDNAMINVMRVLRDIALKKPDYTFVDDDHRAKAKKAVGKGIECILKTQVVVGRKRTVWGAQHDEVTLAPAPARKYEPPSLSTPDSVGIVRFLMGIKNPNRQVVESIKSAVAWFEKSKLTGIMWIKKPNPSKPSGYERSVIKDPDAPPLWARFYEITTNRPIFIGRDSIVKYSVAEIEEERRNGYQWYVTTPARLLYEDYPVWQKKRVGGKESTKN